MRLKGYADQLFNLSVKMKQYIGIFLVTVSFFIFYTSDAQRVNQCGIIIPPRSLQSKFQSVYEAREYINTMLDSINWKENFNIQEQNGFNNAYATIINNRRYIVYDNDFLEKLLNYKAIKSSGDEKDFK